MVLTICISHTKYISEADADGIKHQRERVFSNILMLLKTLFSACFDVVLRPYLHLKILIKTLYCRKYMHSILYHTFFDQKILLFFRKGTVTYNTNVI